MKKITINLNVFRVFAAILVVINHTSPFIQISDSLDYFFVHILSRVAVPFFLMLIGYFSFDRFLKDKNSFIFFLKHIAFIYAVSAIIYIPINIYAGHFTGLNGFEITKLFILEGSMYHLWYFPALLLGSFILYVLLKSKFKYVFTLVLLLYLLGLLGDNYYGLISSNSYLSPLYSTVFYLFTYTRNGIFYVPLFLYLGYYIQKLKFKIKPKILYTVLIVSLLFLIFEGFFIKINNIANHTSIYFMLIPLMFSLFTLLTYQDNHRNDFVSKFTTYLYILHPLVIVLLRLVLKTLKLDGLLNNAMIMFILVLIITSLVSYVLSFVQTRKNTRSPKRVYRELDYEALNHNLNEIKSLKHHNTDVMAIVKANAYGHGIINISRYLESRGIKIFGVATLQEALDLRKANIKGEILILGYTPLSDIDFVIKHNLIQTIINYDYALQIQKLNLKKPLKCHLKVNTGMNRLGENDDHVDAFKHMYRMDCLNVLGIFTHLAVADNQKQEDLEFTQLQIKKYDTLIDQLKAERISVGKCHIQGSYGFSNYLHLNYDYIRMGILLYGIKSNLDDACSLNLQPVMTLKTTVSMTRVLKKQESVSYGRTFITTKPMRIATINIGYADGISRSLSNTDFSVYINNKKCPVVGRICMDQMMVDIKDYPVKSGDEVIIFGKEQGVDVIAKIQGTITNEVLTSLTDRVK